MKELCHQPQLSILIQSSEKNEKKNIIMIKLSTTSKILIIIIVKSQGKKEGKPATIFLLLFS